MDRQHTWEGCYLLAEAEETPQILHPHPPFLKAYLTENFQTDFSLTFNLRTEFFPLNLNAGLPLLNLCCEDEGGCKIPELRQFNL
jgi:hypothetical protein